MSGIAARTHPRITGTIDVAEAVVEVTFTVEPNYAGWRLDLYLCEKIRRLSRVRVQRILRNSLVSDVALKASTRVWPGLTFRLRRRSLVEPETPDTLREVYRDEALLVLDKPAGLPIHPTARYHHGTVVALLSRQHGPHFQAAPAHRLDRETSGLLVCGRTAEASRALMRAFQGAAVQKEYLAIVEGWPTDDGFCIDAPLLEGTKAIRIAVRVDPNGRPASALRLCAAFPRRGGSTKFESTCRPQAFPWWVTKCMDRTRATSTVSAGTALSRRLGRGCACRVTRCMPPGCPSLIPCPGRRLSSTRRFRRTWPTSCPGSPRTRRRRLTHRRGNPKAVVSHTWREAWGGGTHGAQKWESGCTG
jgi:hypothetical protein